MLTSNIGGAAREALGFVPGSDDGARDAEQAARGFFRPELLNRIDERIVFRPLSADDAERIVAGIVATLEREHGARLEVGPEAVRRLTAVAFEHAYGARGLARAVDHAVRAPLADLALRGAFGRQRAWRLACRGDDVGIGPDRE